MDAELDKLIFDNRFKGLLVEAEKDLFKMYSRKIIKMQLENGTYYSKELQDTFDRYKTLLEQVNKKDEYYFITICPYEDIEIRKFEKVVEKLLKKKWLQKYIYVYEQRQSDPTLPIFGIHLHMIVERDKIAKSDVIREVFSTCKSICGSKQSIDVKLINTQQELNVKLNYILGQKSTIEKQQRQIVDKLFREQYQIKSYYKEGEWGDITVMSQ